MTGNRALSAGAHAALFLSLVVFAGTACLSGTQGASTNGAAGSAKEAADPNTVWISRSDGALSCDPGRAQGLEEAASDLKKAGISVLDSRKRQDGKMHIQMCGAPTGSENAYRIRRSELEKALALGFQEVR